MKVLVAIDSSNYADEILEQLVARFWPSGTSFQIITAVESSPSWDIEQEMQHPCKVILEERISYLKKKLPNAEVTGHVSAGRAAKVIVRCARDWPADVVIIGSHGDTGKRMAAIGSVAAEVVNEAHCSVVVVKLRQAGECRTAAAAAADIRK